MQSSGGASFTINATTYRSNSPCTAGTGFGQAGLDCPFCIGWNTSAFTFDVAHGKVQLESALPKGWAVAAAPEIDAYAAGSALSLLVGSMAVFAVGRRFRNRAA